MEVAVFLPHSEEVSVLQLVDISDISVSTKSQYSYHEQQHSRFAAPFTAAKILKRETLGTVAHVCIACAAVPF